MAIKYCPANSCGFRNEYSVTPPKKCSKCNASFAAAFKAVVAAVEEEIIVVKKKRVVEKVKRVPTMFQRMRQAQAESSTQNDVEEEVNETEEIEAEESDDNLDALSADELAASLNPDDMIRFTSGGDGPTKLGSWITQPKA